MGHWEIDTVMGKGSRDCILTLVERASGYTQIGKLPDRTTESLNRRARYLIQKDPDSFETITADNGTEFHQFSELEEKTGILFYFARPYHSWERGTNENTNGLIRQYLPKGSSMKNLSQRQCTIIANILNERPRKRLEFMTPAEVYHGV
jgi:IS30 family transposase